VAPVPVAEPVAAPPEAGQAPPVGAVIVALRTVICGLPVRFVQVPAANVAAGVPVQLLPLA
jgi:hypothetical protein